VVSTAEEEDNYLNDFGFEEGYLDEEDEEGVENVDKVTDDMDAKVGFHMDDFSPSHVFTFQLSSSEECFFEDIILAPIQIRGAYFVSNEGNMDVNVKVSFVNKENRGNEETLFQKHGSTEDVFSVVANHKGQYKFCFSQRSSSSTKHVTFAIHVGLRKREHALKTHVTPLQEAVAGCHRTLNELVSEQNFLLARTTRHMLTQDSTEFRVAWFTIVESIFMISVTLGQVFYIRRLINNRQWV